MPGRPLRKPVWLDDLTEHATLLLDSRMKSEIADHGQQDVARAEPQFTYAALWDGPPTLR